jgi:hypothetical protein
MIISAFWALAVVFAFVVGCCYGMYLSIHFRQHFFTRLYFKVDSEFEIHAIEAVKSMDLCKKSIVSATPSLYMNKDGTIKYVEPKTTILVELSDQWFARVRSFASNGSINQDVDIKRTLDYIREKIEKQDIVVSECGIY